jgi:predicted Rossmann fold flavoprotein
LSERVDLAVVGAGAAGLMAAISAARAAPGLSIALLDGARTLGAKILVAGGGRCNVTHHAVRAQDFAGGSRNAIAQVLRQLPVDQTVEFFRELGVELKREPTGKLFPVTDRARTVLDALLGAARSAGVEVLFPRRVTAVEAGSKGLQLRGAWGTLVASRVILATGGRALPKSGSDGSGYALARALGHSLTPHIFPALVPLLLPEGHFLRALSGVAVEARLEVRAGNGRRLSVHRGALLCTHFGISGPVVLDASRHYLAARFDDDQAKLVACFLLDATREAAERELLELDRRSVQAWLSERLPDRLGLALATSAGLTTPITGNQLRRDHRGRVLEAIFALPLPISGDRGFEHAEATAGGVPLDQIHLGTMESRRTPGLHLCGELLDVDGRIGGFNFQWAWASGAVAGRGAARAFAESRR